MPVRRRDSLLTWLVVGPFAIVLAFPFYWMLQTSLKSELDLYNTENNPFGFGQGSPTLDNYRFLFSDTQYAQWLLNTVVVGLVVVAITLAVALPDALKVRRGYGKWILREAMAGRIPKDIRLARYKRGFDAPPRVWISAGLGSSIRNRLRELRPDTNEFLPAGETTDGLFSDDRLIRHPTAFAEATTLLWLGQSR